MTAARRKRILLAGVLLAVIAAAGAYWLLGSRPSSPPEMDLSGADPDVRSVLAKARQEVLRQPRSGRAWGRLGMLLRAHDFGPESSVCFLEAERLEPRQARWPYLHGLTLLQSDLDAGIVRMQRAAELLDETDTTAPRLRLAEALLTAGRNEEAQSHFREVLRREPDNPRAMVGIARLAVQRGEPRESLDDLRRAVSSPYTRKSATLLLAEVYSRLGDKTALAALGDVTAVPDDPPWPDPFVREVEELRVGVQADIARAEDLFQTGRREASVAALRALVQRRADSDRGWVALGRTHIRLGEHDLAEKALREAVRLAPDSVDGWFLLGAALALQQHHAEAAEAARRAIRLKPDHAQAHYNLGQSLKELGQRSAAADAYRAALRYRPDYEPARKELETLER